MWGPLTEESDAGSTEGATFWEGAAFLGEVVAGASAILLTFDGLTCEASASSPEANPNFRMTVHSSASCLADVGQATQSF